MVDERDVERALVRQTTDRGGLCLKLDSASMKGIQDRLVLLPGRIVVFVELKRPDGGRLSVLQKVRRTQLRRMGFPSFVVKDGQDLDHLWEIIETNNEKRTEA